MGLKASKAPKVNFILNSLVHSLAFPLLTQQEEIVHASLLKGALIGEKDSPYSLSLEKMSWSELARQTSLKLQQMPELSACPHVCWVKQCHGVQIACVQSPGEQPEPADAMITTSRGLGLMVLHADCQALLFYDPVQKVIAAAHVGWRGSVANLPARVIQKMQSAFQVQPENVLVAISPSIGPSFAYYPQYTEHFPQEIWKYQTQGYFNFWSLTQDQLCATGVLPSHIASANLCTHAEPEYFFSHRRDGSSAGRHATVIALRPLAPEP